MPKNDEELFKEIVPEQSGVSYEGAVSSVTFGINGVAKEEALPAEGAFSAEEIRNIYLHHADHEQQAPRMRFKRRSKLERKSHSFALFLVVGIVFVIYSFTLLYPLFFMLLNSFKTNWDFLENVYGLPEQWLFSNYVETFIEYNFPAMFLNSLMFTVLGTVSSIFFTTVSAYIIARYNFFGRKLLWTLIISVMLIPSIGTLSATYRIMFNLHFINSIIGVIVLYSAPFGMNFLLLHGYFKSVSESYAEAARIDGAGHVKTMFYIMLPQASGGIATITLLLFIGFWNDYMTPYLYLPSVPTIAVSLNKLSNNASSRGEYTEMFAGMTIALVPIVALYCVFQKRILSATMTGGLKG